VDKCVRGIEQYFPVDKCGRPRKWELWLIVNAIFYVTRTGCQWRRLPDSFPPCQTIYGYFRRWTRAGL
jgi:transposase